MSNFLLGCALGAIFGILMAALCAAQKMCDNDLIARIDKVRKSATDASHKANASDDAIDLARADGMWEAVKILYGETDEQ